MKETTRSESHKSTLLPALAQGRHDVRSLASTTSVEHKDLSRRDWARWGVALAMSLALGPISISNCNVCGSQNIHEKSP